MTLWTIQSPPAWHQLQATGVLRATAEYAMSGCETAYAWMRAQMVTRIGPPPEPDGYPVWAWSRYDGVKRVRPDLRSARHMDKGERGVRIEIECEPERVLLSDHCAWHSVLNNSYISVSEEDSMGFQAEIRARGLNPWTRSSDPEVVAWVVQSWNLIFDLSRYMEDWTDKPDERGIQACLWEFRIEWVQEVTPFVSR